jgi:NADH:quinone reductase (non-electrogenic)
MDPSRVVIIGAGFGGPWAARALTHSPLLYQVAAAELEPEDIVCPLRSVFHRYPNIHIMLSEVVGIDFSRKEIHTRQHRMGYDYLIISLGSQAYYYGVEVAGEHAFPLKDIEDAVSLRNHILCMFESASSISDEKLRQRMLTFAIVGGGPKGIEFCGALVELVRKPLKRDYPNLDMDQVRIILLEATDRLLRGLPERLHKFALNRLIRMGVEVHLNSPVRQITSSSIVLKDGNIIPSQTVVWMAGVQGSKLSQRLNLPTQPNGQVDVLPSLQVPGHPEIYVVGDMAHMEQGGKVLLMIAPVATQEGVWAAKNVLRQVQGSQPKPFHYKDPGMMAVTGRNAAVVRLGAATLTGFTAWIIWALVHLYRLIGFWNRLLVFINWAMDYIFFERVVRLITPMPPSESSPEGCLE